MMNQAGGRMPGRGRVGVLRVLLLSVWLAGAVCVQAGKVVLQIRAGNPLEKPQKVMIRSALPSRIGTNDILSTAGLDLGYDVRENVFYVHQEIELGAKETRLFEVQLRDIWEIPAAEMARFREWAVTLTSRLSASEYAEEASGLQAGLAQALDRIETLQKEHAIKPGASPAAHIQAYETALQVMQEVRQDVGHLENLVMATGQDPGQLIGDVQNAPPPRRDIKLKPEDYRTVIIRIQVRNPSPTDRRKAPVIRDLPVEVRPDDILDAGGLQVRTDPLRGICTVFQDNVEVPPNESVTFNVRIRDRWNINGPRIRELDVRASNLVARIAVKEKFGTVETALQTIRADLQAIAGEPVPQVLNERYVAFFREQAMRVDAVEVRLNRIDASLRAIDKTSKFGFDKVKAPSAKTTWIIIYIILGFLALMSLLFFLRWYGRSGAEKLDGGQEPKSG
ncbi:MAG: hypothetical protein A2340_02940 [Lentisphaerae bacterium RIFOXYB12_FULL_60_10]|nr:MAG: hypothetical protein A2340_02940 [Lentisphaerae bacterium RIFOXYB12_FULL_60_10]